MPIGIVAYAFTICGTFVETAVNISEKNPQVEIRKAMEQFQFLLETVAQKFRINCIHNW